MREKPFAIIVSTNEGKIIATHVPVEIEENDQNQKVIRTHIAKANPQWKNFSENKDLLVIFNGPHSYISSSWYDHVNVPTWNYIAVHVYGRPKILNDKQAYSMLERLVNRYEQDSNKPFIMNKLSTGNSISHLKAIVAFEISINKIEAKEKLSQNRNEKNFKLILEQLEKREDSESKAAKNEMMRIKKYLFKK